jgi:hypothetical protein
VKSAAPRRVVRLIANPANNNRFAALSLKYVLKRDLDNSALLYITDNISAALHVQALSAIPIRAQVRSSVVGLERAHLRTGLGPSLMVQSRAIP